MNYDLIIRGARVIDPETDTNEVLTVAVKDGSIAFVGNEASFQETSSQGTRVIDAAGLTLSPGFIDIHTHEDRREAPAETDPFNIPREVAACAMRGGVTTIVGGNCGGGNYPIGAYLKALKDARLPINCLTLIGAGVLRRELGIANYDTASSSQIARMKAMAEEALDEGAVGVSFGLEYAPGTSFAEFLALAAAVAEKGRLCSVHIRYSIPRRALEALDEVIAAAEISGAALQISHIAANIYGENNLEETARRIGGSKANIGADMYPYDTWATGIHAAFLDDGLDDFNFNETDVEILSGPLAGQYCTKELYEELRRADYHTAVALHNATPREAIEEAYRLPFVCVGSDAMMSLGADGSRRGHPRAAGTPARFLKEFVRERKLVPLTEGIRKLTLIPALRLSLAKKGRIQLGCDADLTLFDPETIADRADYGINTCALPPEGIKAVFVSGKLVHEGT
jgi:N-acyl-D-amino-acid deacylase